MPGILQGPYACIVTTLPDERIRPCLSLTAIYVDNALMNK